RHRARGAGPDAPQPPGRHQPAVAAGAARPRHRGPRPGGRLPGRQRRPGPRRHPRRRARPLPRAGVAVRRAPRRVAVQHRAPHAPAHAGGGRGRPRRRARLAGGLPGHAGAAPRLRGRRVLPAGRPALPAGRALRRLPDVRGRHRHGPRLRGRAARRGRGPPAGRPRAGRLLPQRRRRARGRRPSGGGARARRRVRRGVARGRGRLALGRRRLRALPGAAGRPAGGHRPAPRGAGRRPHRHLRRPGAGPAPRPARPAGRAGRAGREPLLRRQRRRRRAHGGGGPGPGARRAARRPPLPAARRLPHPGPVPRRLDAGRPAPPRRGRAHRRPGAAGGPRPRAPRRPGAAARHRRELTVGLPVVAIVGRPNVGKSTLLNRIIGRRAAIVEERPGVTRDRKEVEAEWRGRRFRLVDTGGWMAGGTELDEKVSAQAERAMAEADLVLLVVDVTTGATQDDARVAELLRRTGPRAPALANKVDDTSREADAWELLSLGLGEPHLVSALHGRGTGDLLDTVIGQLPEEAGADGDEAADDGPGEDEVAVAIVGRPNVGKSTLFNRLIGEERAIVHDMPGTTRDTVDTVVETDLGRVRLVDTAGMRRKSRIGEGTEYYSLVRALQAVDEADVALLVIDATEGVTG